MNYSLYVHIPFCTHRCAYCDFNTYAGQEAAIPAYVAALTNEIELVAAQAPERLAVHTIFFGGGTPSLLSPEQFKVILDAIRCNYDVAKDAEVTTEANPGTVSPASLEGLRQAGLNRISFGAQSANGEELRMLERTHTFLDVMEAVRAARQAGFQNLNLDLIYGLPEQQLQIWQRTVQRILALEPEHISAYALTLEHGTPFGRWSSRGLLPSPDPDAAAEMYEWASEGLEAAGYGQYEISNWAKKESVAAREGHVAGEDESSEESQMLYATQQPAYACRHNLQYWRCEPYLAFGAGAHGYANGRRYSNALRIGTYIARIMEDRESKTGSSRFPLSPAAVDQHGQTREDEMSDFMITGLRLTREGITTARFRERFGEELTQAYGEQINELVSLGLLEWFHEKEASEAGGAPEAVRLTKRGRLLGNQVFVRFV